MKAKNLSILGPYMQTMLKEHFKGQELKKELEDLNLEQLYTHAHTLYNAFQAEEATQAFGLLIAMDPFSPIFWMGLGASRQMNKEFEKALQAYALASLLDDQDPSPHYHAAQSYLALQNEQEALKALNLAEALIQQNPTHNSMQEGIVRLRECCKTKRYPNDY